MESNNIQNENQEEALRIICDKRTFEAVQMIKSMNNNRYNRVKNLILSFNQQNHTPVDYNTYLKLLENIDEEISITFRRKTNYSELEDSLDFDSFKY